VLLSGGGQATKYGAALPYYASMFFVWAAMWLLIDPRRAIVYTPEDRQRLERAGVLD
jgi:hypothetical protein